MRPDPGGPSSLEAAHARLVAGVEALSSGEDWAQMLAVGARFHSYSANNIMLLMVQAAERGWDPLSMGPIAGYRARQSVGRQVRRGEQGLVVLAPVVTRAVDTDREDDGDRVVVRRVRGFRPVHVFAHDQTDGRPLPDAGPEPKLLEGTAPTGVMEALRDQVASAGFTVAVAPLSPANGRTDFQARTVTLADRLSPAQGAKTLIHELAHALLHDPAGGRAPGPRCRERAEVEAESVAYLVGDRIGLDSSLYTFPYVARWSGGDPEVVRTAAERAMTCARAVLASLPADSNARAGPDLGLCRVEAERPAATPTEVSEIRRARARSRRLETERARQAERAERGWGLER